MSFDVGRFSIYRWPFWVYFCFNNCKMGIPTIRIPILRLQENTKSFGQKIIDQAV